MRYVLTIKGRWPELKRKLKHKYQSLEGMDMENADSKYEELMDSIQVKLGKTRQELIKILNSL